MPAQQARHWCFTLNNYTDDEEQHLGTLHPDKVLYIVYGRETGAQGTPHLQGFVSFESRKVASTVKRLIGRRAHLEVARGTPSQAADYCKKDGDFREFGSIPHARGARNDLRKLQERIVAGATATEIRDEFPGLYYRYNRAIDRHIQDMKPDRDWETNVVVYWGKTGTGKTKQVFEFTRRTDIYTHTGESWFDGYQGQPVVLFDDFNGSEFKLTYLLKLLDRYPMQVPIKGGYVKWVPRTIFITSNKHPDEWYPNAFEEHRRALKRRLNVITEFK